MMLYRWMAVCCVVVMGGLGCIDDPGSLEGTPEENNGEEPNQGDPNQGDPNQGDPNNQEEVECEGSSVYCEEVEACVDTSMDAEHCGTCGKSCGELEGEGQMVCRDEECEPQCDEGWELCGGVCVNVAEDADHCGGCDSPCATGSCSDGGCDPYPCESTEEPFGGGEGIDGEPYTICHVDHLRNIVKDEYRDAWFALSDDINVELDAFSEDIEDSTFEGRLDGLGYAIRGLGVNIREEQGLLGRMQESEDGNIPMVENLALENIAIEGGNQVGGLVGVMDAGEIRNVEVDGQVIGDEEVGGLVGRMNGGVIENVEVRAMVQGSYDVGGVVGSASGQSSMDEVDIDVDVGSENPFGDSARIGGVAGSLEGEAFISHVEGAAVVLQLGEQAGGVVGRMIGESKVEHAYLGDVDVQAGAQVGGVAGRLEGTASIREGTLEGVVSTPGDDAGGVVGTMHGSSEVRDMSAQVMVMSPDGRDLGGIAGRMEDQSRLEDVEAMGVVFGDARLGGVVGKLESDATISVGDTSVTVVGENRVGGFVGVMRSGDYIEEGRASGNVQGTGERIGGFAGEHAGGEIRDSEATGAVQDSAQSSKSVGGFAGESDGDIARSVARGAVLGYENVGGFIGLMKGGDVDDNYAVGSVNGDDVVGGFVGDHDSGNIHDSYATGLVVDDGDAGGFAGENGGTTERSFWDIDTSGQDESAGDAEGRGTADFGDVNTFAEWDFEDTWEMGVDEAGDDRPRLQWEME